MHFAPYCTNLESEDFVPTAETVTFDLGVSHGSLLVELINDDVRELTETFQVTHY